MNALARDTEAIRSQLNEARGELADVATWHDTSDPARDYAYHFQGVLNTLACVLEGGPTPLGTAGLRDDFALARSIVLDSQASDWHPSYVVAVYRSLRWLSDSGAADLPEPCVYG